MLGASVNKTSDPFWTIYVDVLKIMKQSGSEDIKLNNVSSSYNRCTLIRLLLFVSFFVYMLKMVNALISY